MFRKLVILGIIISFSAFNANAGSDGELILKKNQPTEVKDCFENLNRATFAFNQALDGILFQPVASAYRVLPAPVKTGVSNSLDNLSTLVTIPNNILQGELKKAGVNSGRFIINTTIGILGFFDAANYIGLEPVDEDFGQTLGAWGIEPGPYLILPILGPTSARDLGGKVGDWLADPVGLYLIREDYEDFLLATKITKALDTRVELDGVIEGTRENSLDPYAIMRTMYLQRRARLIANEESEETSIYDIDIDVMLLD